MNERSRFIILVLLFMACWPVQADSLTQAAILANTCAGCHGPDGNSEGPATPNISGLSDQYIIDAMEAYKEGDRNSTIMQRIARGYTEQQIELLAEYFASQPRQWPKQATDSQLVKQGTKLHQKYCMKCHENNGRSSEGDAGVLANQKLTYLKFNLDDVLNGQRDVSSKMIDMVKALYTAEGDQGLQQIIHFYASQQ